MTESMVKKQSMERKNEKRVFAGKKYNIYQWEQELYDGTISIFERAEHLPSATVFAIYQGKIVIQKQIQPHRAYEFYSLPGGGIDGDEKALDAAKRELLEEEGLESDDWDYWILGGKQSENFLWENHIYIARDCKKITEPKLDAGERIEHLLFSPDDFFDLLDHADFRHQDILPELLEIRSNPEKRKVFLEKLGLTD